MKIKPYIKELRLKNWLKNVFVFVPAVFALMLFNAEKFKATAFAFAAFCLISSAVYIFNDIRDIEIDRQHPTKRNRPIASGTVSIKNAWTLAVALTLAAFVIAFSLNGLTALIIALYVAENILYSVWLKHMPIFDAFCIAVGFILRVCVGGAATSIPISDWLLLTIVVMSLFMAFGKRRGEMLKVDSANRRAVLDHYDLAFLSGMMFVCAGLSVTFYALWAISRGVYMVYTVPIVIFIVCKYLLLVHGDNSSGDPTDVIFSSRTLLAAVGLYGILTVACLYAEVIV